MGAGRYPGNSLSSTLGLQTRQITQTLKAVSLSVLICQRWVEGTEGKLRASLLLPPIFLSLLLLLSSPSFDFFFKAKYFYVLWLPWNSPRSLDFNL